jgi:predicted nucleic acid-binding protein
MVDCLRGSAVATEFLRKHADRIVLSSIVVAELYAGVKGNREQENLDNLVSTLNVIPVTSDIARAAGLLKRDFGGSHGVGLPDALLAATALVEKTELATLNVKHYPMIKGLRPAYSKG